MSRRECIARLDEFAKDMGAKYGFELEDEGSPPDEREPVDFVPGVPPVCLEQYETRYFFKFDRQFFCREFQNGKMFVRLAAGETPYGERCVRLMAHHFDSQRTEEEGLVRRREPLSKR